MTAPTTTVAAVFMMLGLGAIEVHAATIWNEAIDGELSASGATPSVLSVSAGENSWSGQVGLVGLPEPDSDIVTFTVPSGLFLTSLRLDRYEEAPNIGGGSFLAVAAGTTVDTGFGSVHMSNALVDEPGEWLDDLAAGAHFGAPSANVTGLTAPLPAGNYVVWLGELTTRIDYTLVATLAVPEPTSIVILGGLLTIVAIRTRT